MYNIQYSIHGLIWSGGHGRLVSFDDFLFSPSPIAIKPCPQRLHVKPPKGIIIRNIQCICLIFRKKSGDEKNRLFFAEIMCPFTIYKRKGNYHLEGMPPYILGYEGAGIVEQVVDAVTNFKIEERVGFADVSFANAELVAVPKEKAIPLPENTSFETAASILLQGLTAQYLTKDNYAIKAGNCILIHAAAGGVGQNLVQICKHLGGKVIGLTSSIEKARFVLSLGAEHVFLYKENRKIPGQRLASRLDSVPVG